MTAATQDLMKLYSERILALAATLPLAERLDAPQGSATNRSPLCGSTVTVDVAVDGGRIARFGQDVKACALGQSSASVLGHAVLGRTRAEIQAGRDALYAMLKQGAGAPGAPFDGLEALRPATDFKNRHASILLPWDATLAAMEQAEA
ncbi:MAG: iron-sulfur cluster assembly scaffold protein [Pseudomonadota bacterium]